MGKENQRTRTNMEGRSHLTPSCVFEKQKEKGLSITLFWSVVDSEKRT